MSARYLVSEAQQSRGRPGWDYLGPVEMTRDDLVTELRGYGLTFDPDERSLYVHELPFGWGTRWVVWKPAPEGLCS